MTQNNLYMEDENLRLEVNVQPFLIDELENSKNIAVRCANDSSQILELVKSIKTNFELFYADAFNSFSNLFNDAIQTINNAKNNAVNSINSLGHQVIDFIKTEGQRAINQIQSLSQQVINTVDNNVSLEYLNHSKCVETGNVSENSHILPFIKKYFHSTFARSKFTVAGSTNITDDGIASGFGNGNYLTGSFTATTPKKEYIVKLKIKLSSIPASTNRLWTLKNKDTCFIALYSNDIACRLDGNDNLITVHKNTDINWDINQDIYIAMKVTAFKTYLTVECNGNSITKEANTNSEFISMNTFALGGLYAYFTSGSIDLKQFSITVDGVEVFSGNKTGIDTIKPDDYTEVNSPVISNDGIMMLDGPSNNYVTTPTTIPLSTANTWKIVTPVFTLEENGTANRSIIGVSANQDGIDIFIRSNGNIHWIVLGTINNLTTAIVNNEFASQKLLNGIKYQLAVEFTGTAYNLLLSTNGGVFTQIDTVVSTTKITYNPTLHIGFRGNTEGKGTMDLNTMQVYADGNLVYQPCLKIPYTESFTGSKIAQAIYRDRVVDMYEQFGYAPYYTLSDTDFTLPMGEIYGMMQKIAENSVKEISQ